MAAVNKIDSNVTGLSYGIMADFDTDPTEWFVLEPNSYDNFGGEIITKARNPINSSRQRKKGVTVDLNAAGGFNHDLLQDNLQNLFSGFFFAAYRQKGVEAPTNVDGVSEEFDVASTTGFIVGSLIFARDFDDAGNNGLHIATTVTTDTSIAVAASNLVDDATPAGTLYVVGYQGASADLAIDASGDLPLLTSTAMVLDQLGVIPGEWIYIGGDLAAENFATVANNGWARVNAIAADGSSITFDKTQGTMVTDAGTGKTIRLWFGKVLKNEALALQTRTIFQFERTLGAPDDSLPAQIQSEYLVGQIASEMRINFNTADNVTIDFSFLGTDHETRTGATGVKAGTRNALVAEDAFNTSSSFKRLKIAVLDPTDSNPTKFFAYALDFNFTINNSLSPAKAISVLGAFDITAGQFVVNGSINAYFSDVAAIAAVRSNADVTFDFVLVDARTIDLNTVYSGIAFDIPLLTLGDGRANVEQDQPIRLPVSYDAAADRTFDHTALMVFFDYLPAVADA